MQAGFSEVKPKPNNGVCLWFTMTLAQHPLFSTGVLLTEVPPLQETTGPKDRSDARKEGTIIALIDGCHYKNT